MQITYIGHAMLLVRAGGITILSDPWWRGPCFGAQWWNLPRPAVDQIALSQIDYIYISHGHHDHFHPGTLKSLPRTAKVLMSSDLRFSDEIRGFGFDVIEVPPSESIRLSESVTAWIWPTYGDDTLMVLKSGTEVLMNLNDAVHAAPPTAQKSTLQRLKEQFPNPDYVFCGYGTASHFPNCYRIPGKDDLATATKRQAYFNSQWARIIRELEPRFGFPFAASVVLFEKELEKFNEAVHNLQRPIDAYRALFGEPRSALIDIAPGFQINAGKLVRDIRFKPLDLETLKLENADSVARANMYSAPDASHVARIIELLRANIELCSPFLTEWHGSYLFAIAFRGSSDSILIEKLGDRFNVRRTNLSEIRSSADIVFHTRAAYLRRSLEIPYGDEILFVGSGGTFEYRRKQDADIDLHRELLVMMRRHDTCPSSRFGNQPRAIFHMKRAIKAMTGRAEHDLYALREWVVYQRS